MGLRRSRSRAGFSIIELAVSAAVLLSGILAVVLTMSSAAGHAMAERERVRALEAARSALEQARELPFEQVFALLNEQTGDDPGGTGTAPGAGFVVRGVSTRMGDADGLAGRYVFPVITSSGVLSEIPNNEFQGIGRDLNGDGDATDTDVSTTYVRLPLAARVEWRGLTGEGEVEVTTILRGVR